MNETPLNLTALRHALRSLQDSLAIVGQSEWFARQDERLRNTLMAGVIQNFEFVYEISVKMMRRQIAAEAAAPDEAHTDSFRDLLRTAAEKGLVDDVQAWFGYRTMRNITAHTYHQEHALQVYAGTEAFVRDAQALLNALEQRNAP